MPSERESCILWELFIAWCLRKAMHTLNPLNHLKFSFHQPAIVLTASVPCWLRGIHRSLMGNPSPRREVKGSLR